MSANWGWLRRIRQYDTAMGGGAPSDVARVQIVSNAAPDFDTFELRPRAYHHQHIPAAAALSNNVIILSGTDTRGAGGRCWVLPQFFIFNATTATLSVGLVPLSSLTLVGLASVTPLQVDPQAKSEITPTLQTAQILTANIPAAGTAGWSPNYPAANIATNSWVTPFVSVDRALVIIQNGPVEAINFKCGWQAVRM